MDHGRQGVTIIVGSIDEALCHIVVLSNKEWQPTFQLTSFQGFKDARGAGTAAAVAGIQDSIPSRLF